MNTPQEFELKPPRIRAIQWTGNNLVAVRAFCPSIEPVDGEEDRLVITASEVNGRELPANNLPVNIGDWVFENGGPFFVMSNEALAGSYRQVLDTPSGQD